MHRRCLRDFHCFVLIILRPLLFSVWHFLRNLTLSDKIYHSKILKNRFYYLIPLASVLLLFMKKNTCYNLFFMPLPIPIIRYLLYKHFLFCFFSLPLFVKMWTSWQVDELTSGRVDKWTSCLRRRQRNFEKLTSRQVDKWTSRQVNKLLAAINTANSSNHNYGFWIMHYEL